MAIPAEIINNKGRSLEIDSFEGSLGVVIHQHPYVGETLQALPFRQYFTDNGGKSGSNLMSVDGSTNFVDFYIEAQSDYDVYVKYITCEIGDGGAPSLNKFGALPALTNGLAWYWDTLEEPLYELHEGIKTNKEFIRIASDTGAIGTGVEAYLADVSGGGTEKSYLPNIDTEEIYGLQYGLRLRKGSRDKLVFRVRDNLTGLTTFNAIATGTRI